MNIVILASIGAGNLGDELILKNEIFLLEKQFSTKNPVFAVFSYNKKNIFYKKNNIEYLEYFPIGIKNPKNFFRNLKNFFIFIKTIIVADLVVIGGGGIFFDNEKHGKNTNLLQWNFRTKIIRFFKKNILFWGVGIDISNKKNLKILKKIFSKAYNITVRDKNSFEILNSIGIKSNIIKDPVFFDPLTNGVIIKKEENNLIFWEDYKKFSIENLKNIDFSFKKIGIAFRYGFLEEEKILDLIKFLIKKNIEKIFFIPHSFHQSSKNSNDYIFLKKILDKLIDFGFDKQKFFIAENMQESYDIYKNKKIDLNFAMRLHSIILSEVYNIKFIGISYSTKTQEILNQIEKN